MATTSFASFRSTAPTAANWFLTITGAFVEKWSKQARNRVRAVHKRSKSPTKNGCGNAVRKQSVQCRYTRKTATRTSKTMSVCVKWTRRGPRSPVPGAQCDQTVLRPHPLLKATRSIRVDVQRPLHYPESWTWPAVSRVCEARRTERPARSDGSPASGGAGGTMQTAS